MLLHHKLSSNLEGISDQYKNLGNCPPTSPLIQRFVLSETSVFTLSLRGVGWLFPNYYLMIIIIIIIIIMMMMMMMMIIIMIVGNFGSKKLRKNVAKKQLKKL